MRVFHSPVIRSETSSKNCARTSPQSPNRTHQGPIYRHFVFFFKFSFNLGLFFSLYQAFIQPRDTFQPSFYLSPLGLTHDSALPQLNLVLPLVRPYFHMGIAFDFSIGLFCPYRLCSYFTCVMQIYRTETHGNFFMN